MEYIVGFILGIATLLFKISHENKIQANNLASAFYGEIGAILEVALKNENVKFLKKLESDFTRGEFHTFYISFKSEYFQVYKGNISKIGYLKKPNPELISKFYIYSSSILDELEAINVHIEKGLQNAKLVKRFHQLCILFEETGHIGVRCREQLNNDYTLCS